MKKILMLAMVLGLLLIPLTGFADDLENIISKYGRPDTYDSTEYDNPRPPIVTKWISYKKQGVTFFFVPDAKLGDAPPYKGWKLMGATDPILNKALSVDEIKKRFGY